MNAAADNANLEAIHILRGLAAVLVVFFHLRVFFDYLVPNLGGLFEGGYAGVDIFFVISGFIICYSTQRPQGAAQFLVRRLFRVWLPAVLASAAYCWVNAKALSPWQAWQLLTLEPQGMQGGPYYGYGVYFITWTIAYELCFYAVFAVALAISHRWRVPIALGLLLVGGALLQFALAGTWSSDPYALDIAAREGLLATLLKVPLLAMNPLSWMFAIGMLFFLAWPQLRRAMARVPEAWLALGAAILLLVFAFGYFSGARGHGLFNIGAFAISAFAAFVLLQEVIDRRAARGRAAPAVPMFFGTLSYSLYLCHPIVMDLRYVVPNFSALNLMSVPFVLLTGVVIASALFYRLVEVPSQRLGRAISLRLGRRAQI